jgi:hypothetical protein
VRHVDTTQRTPVILRWHVGFLHTIFNLLLWELAHLVDTVDIMVKERSAMPTSTERKPAELTPLAEQLLKILLRASRRMKSNRRMPEHAEATEAAKNQLADKLDHLRRGEHLSRNDHG